MTAARIRRLALTNFRSYRAASVAVDSDAVVLVKLRGFPRRGIYGGCGIRVGKDPYWLYPAGECWYAFPLPLLPQNDIDLTVTFTRNYVPGYSEPQGEEARRIHILDIITCSLTQAPER